MADDTSNHAKRAVRLAVQRAVRAEVQRQLARTMADMPRLSVYYHTGVLPRRAA